MASQTRSLVSLWKVLSSFGILAVPIWAESSSLPFRTLEESRQPERMRQSKLSFPVGGVRRFVMRYLPGPEGAVDFRILGEPGSPAILSLIGPDKNRYADYTYNGSDADFDVSYGGLNLRPLDGRSAVTVWSLEGDTRLRIGSKNFQESLDVWHTGNAAFLRSTTGRVVVDSFFETRSDSTVGGNIYIKGVLRASPRKPESSEASCLEGQILWDAEFIYVCTSPNTWKRAQLLAY